MNLQKWLTQNRWSREAFAERLTTVHKVKVSRQSVDAYINGHREPGYEFIQAVYEFTDGNVKQRDIKKKNSR